jgi:hypothetical protein
MLKEMGVRWSLMAPYSAVQDRDGGQQFVCRVALGFVIARSLIILCKEVALIHRKLSWSRGSLTVGSRIKNYAFTTADNGQLGGIECKEEK